MAELTPYPLGALALRMFRELEHQGSIFDLPASRFFLGDDRRDLSVSFQGHAVASPLGPAAGPHSQMAQNLVLAWLGGARVMELKTVQILDRLQIPRPCIDMRTVGLNAEWSQELRLEQSLEEYVKAAMLIRMLEASGRLQLARGFGGFLFDLSVGYDLAGIRSEAVERFLRGMVDASETIEHLRRQLPAELGALRDLDFPRHLADTVTLSTFHGCPPEEIEQIIEFLLEHHGLHSIIKFNPMLLGADETRQLLHEQLGYEEISVPDSAFERDARWEQAVGIVERLRRKAEDLGLGLGVKLTNTLIVENNQGFLPASEKEVYLSGAPLHVLAMHLVRRFRRQFGGELPISFSAGIDRFNCADAIALGLVPVTVCSDLLRKGGYGRLPGYYNMLLQRMDEVGARSSAEWILKAFGEAEAALAKADAMDGEPHAECLRALRAGVRLEDHLDASTLSRWLAAARVLNTEQYVAALAANPRYHQEANSSPPRKIGRHLQLFDCITCDLCVPVCPNDANFTYSVDVSSIPIVELRRGDSGWSWIEKGVIEVRERHQIGNFADFCNDCGNCDVFCPEDGGPYVIKPRFFRRVEDWRKASELDGFQVERSEGQDVMYGRIDGNEFCLVVREDSVCFEGAGFRVNFERPAPRETLMVEGEGPVDLTFCFIMDALRPALLDAEGANYVNSLARRGLE